jgi:hypothetical protein
VLVERDVGLFSLVQQVVSHLPWAFREGRVPVARFGPGCAYWVPGGFHEATTVWEYYFEPVVRDTPLDAVPRRIARAIAPIPDEAFRDIPGGHVISSNFGDHPALAGKTLRIPYLWADPDHATRAEASKLISAYVRPREYIERDAAEFLGKDLDGRFTIGVHIRGTDALTEGRIHRRGSLDLARYIGRINALIRHHPDARVFVASDSQTSVDAVQRAFPGRVISMDVTRDDGSTHGGGRGPQGWSMPYYIATDRARAAQNGADAVTEYLVLARCGHLVHNGSGMARTVLLANPRLPHTNVHLANRRVVWINKVVEHSQSVSSSLRTVSNRAPGKMEKFFRSVENVLRRGSTPG